MCNCESQKWRVSHDLADTGLPFNCSFFPFSLVLCSFTNLSHMVKAFSGKIGFALLFWMFYVWFKCITTFVIEISLNWNVQLTDTCSTNKGSTCIVVFSINLFEYSEHVCVLGHCLSRAAPSGMKWVGRLWVLFGSLKFKS